MKILFWADGFHPRIGGIETQSLEFITEMQKRGHQFRVVAQKDAGDLNEEIHLGIPIQRFDFQSMIFRRRLRDLRLIEAYLESVMRDFQPDLIHLNACIGEHAFVFLLLRSLFRIPIVLTVHAPYLYRNEEKTLIHQIVPQVAQVCCVSNWVLGEMKRLTPQYSPKLRLIHNGLALTQIAPQPLIFSPPTLLLLGRLSSEKGFDTAIEAFALLKQKGSSARLLIGGDGGERLFLERLVATLGLNHSVQFLGELDKMQVFSSINEATLVLVPSYSETFGLVALEAMQMGRPVIASRVGGLPEIVSENKTGLLVPPKDPMALFLAIEELLGDPERAQEMGLQGRKRAIDQFSLMKNMVQYETLYQELL